jgi:inner membrane transporter RhtA
MPERIFGVLLSTAPVAGALAGWLVLDQALGARELTGVLLVTAAVAGAVNAGRVPRPS